MHETRGGLLDGGALLLLGTQELGHRRVVRGRRAQLLRAALRRQRGQCHGQARQNLRTPPKRERRLGQRGQCALRVHQELRVYPPSWPRRAGVGHERGESVHGRVGPLRQGLVVSELHRFDKGRSSGHAVRARIMCTAEGVVRC